MFADLRIPAVVAGRKDSEPTDGPLSAFLTSIQEIDGERLTFDKEAHEVLAQRVVRIADRALPVSGAARSDLEIDREPTELVHVVVRLVDERAGWYRIPAVQECDAGAEIAPCVRDEVFPTPRPGTPSLRLPGPAWASFSPERSAACSERYEVRRRPPRGAIRSSMSRFTAVYIEPRSRERWCAA